MAYAVQVSSVGAAVALAVAFNVLRNQAQRLLYVVLGTAGQILHHGHIYETTTKALSTSSVALFTPSDAGGRTPAKTWLSTMPASNNTSVTLGLTRVEVTKAQRRRVMRA